MITNWRTILIVALLVLSIVDITATFLYVRQYKAWQPTKPYNLIELNPLLCFLWNKLGLYIGMIVGSVVMLTLVFIVGRDAHWVVGVLLFCVLIWAMFNHFNNFGILQQLIEKYPSGSLPEEVFGIVKGSN